MSSAADFTARRERPHAVPSVDTVLDYPGAGRPLPYPRAGRCRVRVFAAAEAPGHTVVLVTDLGYANPGPSVTNAAETIATEVHRRYALDPGRTLVVEHYDGRVPGTAGRDRRDGVEDFDRVAFTISADRDGSVCLTDPHWRPLRKAAVESLVGGRLP